MGVFYFTSEARCQTTTHSARCGANSTTDEQPAFEFDTWFGKLPPHEQEGLDNYTAALKNALDDQSVRSASN